MSDATELRRPITPAFRELTPAQVRDAQRVVARNAHDIEDCRLLLDVLGLLPGQPEPRSSTKLLRMVRGDDA